jgi:hypothetical protein
MTAKQSVAVDVGSRTLRTSIAPITLFSCSSVVGVGPPTQLNLGVNQDIQLIGKNEAFKKVVTLSIQTILP